jgi:hypothetical protein
MEPEHEPLVLKDLIETKGETARRKKEGCEVFNRLIKEAEKETEEICKRTALV